MRFRSEWNLILKKFQFHFFAHTTNDGECLNPQLPQQCQAVFSRLAKELEKRNDKYIKWNKIDKNDMWSECVSHLTVVWDFLRRFSEKRNEGITEQKQRKNHPNWFRIDFLCTTFPTHPTFSALSLSVASDGIFNFNFSVLFLPQNEHPYIEYDRKTILLRFSTFHRSAVRGKVEKRINTNDRRKNSLDFVRFDLICRRAEKASIRVYSWWLLSEEIIISKQFKAAKENFSFSRRNMKRSRFGVSIEGGQKFESN